jgi:chromosome partitioning protein
VRVPFRSRDQKREGKHVENSDAGSRSVDLADPEESPGVTSEANRTTDLESHDEWVDKGGTPPLLEEMAPEPADEFVQRLSESETPPQSPMSSSTSAETEPSTVEPASVESRAAAASDLSTVSSSASDDLHAMGSHHENGVGPMPLEDAPPAATDEEPKRRALPRVVAVANQKGGVGKTTTAVNLGAGLAELGYRVLVIDLDPQGNATTGLGIDARNFDYSMYDVIMKDVTLDDCIEPTSMKNLFVAPATIDLAGAEIELVPAFSREFKLRKAIQTVIDDFDYILIDCPPSLGLITINGLAAAHEVLVPIQCEYYALEGLSQLLRNVQLVQSNLNEKLEVSTIVLTMYDARTKLADQVASEVREHFGAKVCRNVIPRTVRISEAPSFGQPITVFDPTSRGAIAYRELAKEVSGGET